MELLQILINAATVGSIYALVAIGITLFFGVLRVVNLAHGDIATFAIFMGIGAYNFVSKLGFAEGALNAVIAIVIALLLTCVAGGVIFLVAFRPLKKAPAIVGLLASVAIGFIIRESIFNFYPDGRNPHFVPQVIPPTVYQVMDVTIVSTQLIVISVAVVLAFTFAAIVERTRYGLAIRSVAADANTARLLGVSADRTLVGAFVAGAFLAGVAGLLNGLHYGIVQFDMGIGLTVKGFTAAVIGGLGNIRGALIGGLLIGLVEAGTSSLIPDGGAFRDVVVFGILIAILLVRPTGLLGRTVSEKV